MMGFYEVLAQFAIGFGETKSANLAGKCVVSFPIREFFRQLYDLSTTLMPSMYGLFGPALRKRLVLVRHVIEIGRAIPFAWFLRVHTHPADTRQSPHRFLIDPVLPKGRGATDRLGEPTRLNQRASP